MKLIIFILVIGGIIYWVGRPGAVTGLVSSGVNQLGKTGPAKPAGASTPSGSNVSSASPAPVAPLASGLLPPQALSSVLKPGQTLGVQGEEPPPPSWDSYRFRFRQPPSAEYMQRWQDLGVSVVVDPVARLVSIKGQDRAVRGVREALEAMDCAPQGCCLQAWTVYVDRRVQKGFDLVSALGAVTSAATSTLELHSGGLVLNVSGDRIKSALEVIADGGAVEVVQRPYVRLVNGEDARVESIEQVPTPETVVANGVAQTSIKYQKVGLQLTVTPSFFDNGMVRLGVVQTNGVVGSTVKVGDNDVAVIQSQTVASTAEMTVGQTIVLGGVRTTRKETKRGIFGTKDDFTEGSLYVVLSTYRDEPKALIVDAPVNEFPASLPADFQPPLTETTGRAADWIYDGLLPPKPAKTGWHDQEREFIDSRHKKKIINLK